MKMAFGILFIWLGAACLWVTFHGTVASTPWGAFQEVANDIRAQQGSGVDSAQAGGGEVVPGGGG